MDICSVSFRMSNETQQVDSMLDLPKLQSDGMNVNILNTKTFNFSNAQNEDFALTLTL